MRPLRSYLSELDSSAAAAWSGICVDLGYNPTRWSLSVLSRRDDPHIARIVLRAIHRDGQSVVLKHELRPDAPEGFAAQYRFLETVHAACQWDDRFKVPRPIYLDVERRACLMEYAPGAPMSDLMRDAHGDLTRQDVLLRRAGGWLSLFHGDQLDARRPFRPKFTLRWFHRVRDEIVRGERAVPSSDLFLRGIRTLDAVAPRFDGVRSASCAQHGDMHMRNLVMSGDTVWGLDVSKSDPAPVGHDVAKLLFDYVSLFVPAGEIPEGEVLPDRVRKAFFAGYEVVDPDDPSVGFLIYVKLLSTWLHVPADPTQRTAAKQRTLDRILPIAERAFIYG
tara:strand:+ start:492 stop:1496 length:1005 start_codon:yes stop_codon:yes gene_type:complete